MNKFASGAVYVFCLMLLCINSVSAQYVQNFETGTTLTGDCAIAQSFSYITQQPIEGARSIQSSQLSNPNAPVSYETPWLDFTSGGNVVFSHRRNNTTSGNITVRLTYIDAATETPITSDVYTYSSPTDVNINRTTIVPVAFSGVYKIRISFQPAGGGNARVFLDNIVINNATRSTVGANQPASSPQCLAVIPNVIPPAVNPNVQSTPLDTSVSFDLIANDTPRTNPINPNTVDLNPATSTLQSNLTVAGQGNFNVANGIVTFTPVTGFTGTASISYTVRDTAGATSNVTNINVRVGLPTAATVLVRGRVIDKNGRGVWRTRITLTEAQTGETFISQTNPFGYFYFSEIVTGRLIIVTANHKKFSFVPNVITANANEEELLVFNAVTPAK